MKQAFVTVQDLATKYRVAPKAARRWLRKAALAWHVHHHPWTALEGSPELDEMERVIRAHAPTAT